jgi:hypothetical protein
MNKKLNQTAKQIVSINITNFIDEKKQRLRKRNRKTSERARNQI